MTAERNYDEVLGAYTAQLRSLFGAPGMDSSVGADLAEPDQLPTRAEQLADLAEQVGRMTVGLLDAPDQAQQLTAEARLLAHAAASAEAARKLLATATLAGMDAAQAPTDDSAGVSMDDLAGMVETPPSPPTPTTAPLPPVSADPEVAKASLSEEASKSVDAITVRTCQLIDTAISDLLLLDAATLIEGVALVSKDAAQMLQQAAAALGALAARLVFAAIRLLLQAFDAILALLGGSGQQPRQQISQWVDQLKSSGKANQGVQAITALVTRMYEPDEVKKDVETWVQSTTAPPAEIAQTATTVQGLSEHFDATAQRIEQLLKVIVVLKALPLAKTPQGTVVVASALLGVAGFTVCTGYFHVDSGRIELANRFGIDLPQRIAGVRQTVMAALAADQPPTPTSTATSTSTSTSTAAPSDQPSTSTSPSSPTSGQPSSSAP